MSVVFDRAGFIRVPNIYILLGAAGYSCDFWSEFRHNVLWNFDKHHPERDAVSS